MERVEQECRSGGASGARLALLEIPEGPGARVAPGTDVLVGHLALMRHIERAWSARAA